MKAKILIPESLSEITLAQYQSYLKNCSNLEGELLKQRTVEHFCNVPLTSVYLIKQSEVNEINDHINSLFMPEKEFEQLFILNGVEFGFIPKLDDITAGEFADLDDYVKSWETMHKAMAVLYRPISTKERGKYDVLPYEGTDEFAEVMKIMPLNVAMGALVFFYRLGNELLKATPRYLTEQLKEGTFQKLPNLTNNGDGILASINLLVEMLEDSMKLLDSHLQPHSHF